MAKKAGSRKTTTPKRGKASKTGSAKVAKKAATTAKRAATTVKEAVTAKKAAKSSSRKSRGSKRLMTRSEVRHFYKMLLEKRRELVGDMTGIEAEALGADRQESKGDISDHPADAATDNFEQEFSLGLLESERIILGEIDEALERIEEGSYGVCVGTGQPISKARLTARPWSKYGIEYARMVEKGLVRPGESMMDDEGDDDDDDE